MDPLYIAFGLGILTGIGITRLRDWLWDLSCPRVLEMHRTTDGGVPRTRGPQVGTSLQTLLVAPPGFLFPGAVAPTSEAVMAMMRAAPWVEFQPGMFNRRIELRCSLPDGEHALVLFDSQDHCQICDKQISDLRETPMLCDALWDRLFPQSGVVCLPCLEDRLGRPLTLEDLTEVPWNKYWIQRNRLKTPSPQKEI